MTCQLLFLGSPLLLVAIAQGLCMRYDWLTVLKRPLDLGLSFKGGRVFGDHKTWRGLVINLVFCVVGSMIQTWLQHQDYISPWLLLVDYREHGLLTGLMLGLGITSGELPNSFLKRRMKIAPGNRKKGVLGVLFFLLDQVDLTIGIWVFSGFLIRPSLSLVAWSIFLTLVLHVAVSAAGYLLRMRQTIA